MPCRYRISDDVLMKQPKEKSFVAHVIYETMVENILNNIQGVADKPDEGNKNDVELLVMPC